MAKSKNSKEAVHVVKLGKKKSVEEAKVHPEPEEPKVVVPTNDVGSENVDKHEKEEVVEVKEESNDSSSSSSSDSESDLESESESESESSSEGSDEENENEEEEDDDDDDEDEDEDDDEDGASFDDEDIMKHDALYYILSKFFMTKDGKKNIADVLSDILGKLSATTTN